MGGPRRTTRKHDLAGSVPTFEATARFWRDHASLTDTQRATFRAAIVRFIEDLGRGRFRAGLRVKSVQGAPGVFEMTWAPDGRATFQFGAPITPGEPHVIWRRVGTHTIFSKP